MTRPIDATTSQSVETRRIKRYNGVAQALHWLTALLMAAAIIVAWVFMALPDSSSERFAYITVHKSLGQTIFLLTVARLFWRFWHPFGRRVGSMARWEVRISALTQWLLYAALIAMPVSGYILATAAARPSPYFWLFYWPQPPLVPAVAHAALRVHLIGQYLVYALVALHVAGVAWHIIVRKDGTLDRMLPPQRADGNRS